MALLLNQSLEIRSMIYRFLLPRFVVLEGQNITQRAPRDLIQSIARRGRITLVDVSKHFRADIVAAMLATVEFVFLSVTEMSAFAIAQKRMNTNLHLQLSKVKVHVEGLRMWTALLCSESHKSWTLVAPTPFTPAAPSMNFLRDSFSNFMFSSLTFTVSADLTRMRRYNEIIVQQAVLNGSLPHPAGVTEDSINIELEYGGKFIFRLQTGQIRESLQVQRHIPHGADLEGETECDDRVVDLDASDTDDILSSDDQGEDD